MSASDAEPEAPRRAACPTCKAVFRGDFRRCSNDGTPLVVGGPDPLVGTVLAERYQIEQVLGDGGLGRVYRARHVRMSRKYAIKVPFGDVGYDRKSRARLSNEAEAASRLDHPNVIGVVDVGETQEGLFYLAMDLAEGESLADLLGGGPLGASEALDYLVQLCAGLAHAHDRGLIHRDLKPDNIVVSATSDGQPLIQIIDFGLALLHDQQGSRLTTEGLVVGTPYYMAPEQSTDEPLDNRTDLFTLGIIFYEMLAGDLPFQGTPTAVARQNLAIDLPTVFERSGRAVDPLLDGLIGWMTRKRPDERPASARIIGELARLVLAGDRAAAREMLPESLRPALPAQPPTVAQRAAPDAMAPTQASPPSAPVAVTRPDTAEPTSDVDHARIAPVGVATPTAPVARHAATSEVTRNPFRRYGVVALVGLAIGALIALTVRVVTKGDGGGGSAARTIDAALPVAVAVDAASAEPSVDAGVAVVSTPDAAEAVALEIDAGARVKADAATIAIRPEPRDAGTRPLLPPDARVATTPPVDAAPPPPRSIDAAPPPRAVDAGAVTPPTASLKGLYSQVTSALNAATTRHGADRTAALSRRFDAVPPYSDAVRNPTLRAQAEEQLRALLRDLAALGN